MEGVLFEEVQEYPLPLGGPIIHRAGETLIPAATQNLEDASFQIFLEEIFSDINDLVVNALSKLCQL